VPLAITGVAARSFHVRLVLELVMPPPGLDPSFTAESTRATAEGAFRNAHAALSVMIQARVQTTKGKGRRLGPLSAARSRAPVAPLVARTGRAGGLARA
jgi:hypothetical protein